MLFIFFSMAYYPEDLVAKIVFVAFEDNKLPSYPSIKRL
jgi:hypothetical protein